MVPVLDIVRLVFQTWFAGLFGWVTSSDFFLFPLMIVLVLFIVMRQHSRQAAMEKTLFGASFSRPWRQTLISLGFGVVGGFVASMLMVSLGISLSQETGIQFVWPVVLVLMLIAPRFMCFAYGGGIVGLVVLMLRALSQLFPALADAPLAAALLAVDLPALMALVGLLHLTESLLIFVSGHLNASPVMIQSPGGKMVGGYMLQRFWPLPLAALLALAVPEGFPTEGSVAMPQWWPLLQPVIEAPPGMVVRMLLFPLVAALGYSDLAVTSTPRQRSKTSARGLLAYSVVLLALAFAAGQWRFLQILPVLFAPLGHEYLIQAGMAREWLGKARYVQQQRGVKLLAVLPASAAADAGLDSDWVVLSVNGNPVNSRKEMASALALFPGLADIDVRSPDGQVSQLTIHQRQGKLGLIPVPDADDRGGGLKIQSEGIAARLWSRWRNRRRGR